MGIVKNGFPFGLHRGDLQAGCFCLRPYFCHFGHYLSSLKRPFLRNYSFIYTLIQCWHANIRLLANQLEWSSLNKNCYQQGKSGLWASLLSIAPDDVEGIESGALANFDYFYHLACLTTGTFGIVSPCQRKHYLIGRTFFQFGKIGLQSQ